MAISNRQLFLKYVGQTSANPPALEVAHADGIFFYTPQGEKYYDLVSGVSVSALGHGHPAVIEAVKHQVDRHMHLMVYGEIVQSPQADYAKWIVDHLPPKLNNVYFVNSGSEAIEGAMKLAKRFTGRPEILAFTNAYHGSTHGALSILGDPKMRSGFYPLLPGIQHADFNDPASVNMITVNTAAVVVEPIQAEAGIIEPRDAFLEKIADRCTETGTLLILDEIQTGFGRTGKLFAFEHYNIIPDILCCAKSFGGGMPLGAFISKTEIMKTLTFDPPLGHITTFGGHPVSCAAGLATQKYIENNKLILHGEKMGSLYKKLMKHKAISAIRGRGLFLAVEFNNLISGPKLMQNIFKNKIIVDQFLFCDTAFRIAPPLIISEEEVRASSELLLNAINSSQL